MHIKAFLKSYASDEPLHLSAQEMQELLLEASATDNGQVIQKALECIPNVFLDLDLHHLDEHNPLAVCIKHDSKNALHAFLQWDSGILDWKFKEYREHKEEESVHREYLPTSLFECALVHQRKALVEQLIKADPKDPFARKTKDTYKTALALLLCAEDVAFIKAILVQSQLKHKRLGQGVRSFPKISLPEKAISAQDVVLKPGQRDVVDDVLYSYFVEKEALQLKLKSAQEARLLASSRMDEFEQQLVGCLVALRERQHALWYLKDERGVSARGLAMFSFSCTQKSSSHTPSEMQEESSKMKSALERIIFSWYALSDLHSLAWGDRLKEEVAEQDSDPKKAESVLREMQKHWQAVKTDVKERALVLVKNLRQEVPMEDPPWDMGLLLEKPQTPRDVLLQAQMCAYKTIFEYANFQPKVLDSIKGMFQMQAPLEGFVWQACFGRWVDQEIKKGKELRGTDLKDWAPLVIMTLSGWLEVSPGYSGGFKSDQDLDCFEKSQWEVNDYLKIKDIQSPQSTLLNALFQSVKRGHGRAELRISNEQWYTLLEQYELGQAVTPKEKSRGSAPRL